MWISEMAARAGSNGGGAKSGEVTIGGASAAVMADGETRGAEFYSPGGYRWLPAAGDGVLLIEREGGGFAVVGVKNAPPAAMRAGEVYISSSGGAELRLKNSGAVEIVGDMTVTGNLSVSGSLTVNGVTWSPPII